MESLETMSMTLTDNFLCCFTKTYLDIYTLCKPVLYPMLYLKFEMLDKSLHTFLTTKSTSSFALLISCSALWLNIFYIPILTF